MDEVRWLILSVSALFLAQLCAGEGLTRKLNTTILCPGSKECLSNGSYINVAYTKADGANDRIHYVYTSFGFPSVFVAKTSVDSDLKLNLTRFLSDNETDRANSLTFTKNESVVVMMLVFTKLIEFNDVDNTGKIPNNVTLLRNISLADQSWEDSSNMSDVSNGIVKFTMRFGESQNQTGNVTFKFQAFGSDGKNTDLPHLHFNANITQVYVTLDNLATTFAQPRFAVEMVAVVTRNESKGHDMTINDVKSIDDETTPGAFHLFNWAEESSDGVFLQWKPICYTGSAMAISNARAANRYGPKVSALTPDAKLVEAYFGDLETVDTNATIISFGETDDKFYTASKYTTWALSIGYGMPPEEKVSLLVILIISIGLGIPIVLIIIGGIYVIVKRHRQRGAVGYEDLTSSYPPIGT